MGIFWDFMRYGLPVGGALGSALWANKKGMTPIPAAAIGVLGWGVGYGVYRLASGAANAVEGLPSQTMVPQVGQPPVNQISTPFPLGGAQPAAQEDPIWNKVPGADYQNETRGANGQPPHQAAVIDIGTRQPIQQGNAPVVRSPQPYDPGDSFGGGGSQGGN